MGRHQASWSDDLRMMADDNDDDEGPLNSESLTTNLKTSTGT